MPDEFENTNNVNDAKRSSDVKYDKLLYKGYEFEKLAGEDLKRETARIKNLFFQKKNFYNAMSNNSFIYHDWLLYNNTKKFFEEEYTLKEKEWNRSVTSNNINSYHNYFLSLNEIFYKMDVLLEETISKTNYYNMVSFGEDVVSNIKESISNGIQDLIQFKGKMNLEGSLKTHVEGQKNSSFRMKWAFCSFLVIVILLIPVTLIFMNEIEYIKKLSIESQYSLKIGISISFLVLSYFFFSQYRLYQLIHIKYSHLDGLLGGGAEYLNQIYNFDKETQKALDLKVINLILEITDVFNLIKQSKHPAEMSLTEFSKIVNGVNQVKKKVEKNSE